MRTISATEASRNFSDLLDAIERGETVRITRGNRPVAEITPARRGPWIAGHSMMTRSPWPP